MPHDRDIWLERIKAIERDEHLATRFAVDWLLKKAGSDPTVLQGRLRLRNLQHAAENLDFTYLIRLFAEFETGLRSFWSTFRVTNPPVRDLIEGVAARSKRVVPQVTISNAHLVRKYRNLLVHESDEVADVISIDVARSYLCTFFSYLPKQW
jgi:hypothetical protein